MDILWGIMKNIFLILNFLNLRDGYEVLVMKNIFLLCYYLDLGLECVLVSLICKESKY